MEYLKRWLASAGTEIFLQEEKCRMWEDRIFQQACGGFTSALERSMCISVGHALQLGKRRRGLPPLE